MARVSQNLEINNFSGGLNTEASPLTFPPNASLDEQNMLLQKDGSRKRRNGLELQAGESTVVGTSTALANCFMEATNVRDGFINLNRFSHFVFGSNFSVQRTELKDGSVSWNDIAISGQGVVDVTGISNPDGEFCNTLATTSGITVMTSSVAVPEATLTTYQVGSEQLFEGNLRYPEIVSVRTRDLWGSLNETDNRRENERYLPYQPGESRPSSVNAVYNLLNSTWHSTYPTTDEIKNGLPPIYRNTLTRSVNALFNDDGNLPAITDNFWAYTTDTILPDWAENGAEGAYGSVYVTYSFTNTSLQYDTGRIFGKFTIDPFDRSNSRVQEVIDYWQGRPILNLDTAEGVIPTFSVINTNRADKDTGFMNCITAHLGRVWYVPKVEQAARIQSSPDLNSTVFFSQTISNPSNVAKCYSDVSPTAEDFEAIPATSGGFVDIEGVQDIVRLEPLQQALMVFAKNGVWQIDGGEDNFSATSLRVQKLSSVGCEFSGSVVSTGAAIYYWAKGGIYQVVQDTVSLKGTESNVSYTSVNRLIVDAEYPERVKGAYDTLSNEIRWLFCEKGFTTVPRQCSSELVLDTISGAFTVNRFPTGTSYPQLVGYLELDRSDRTDTDRGSSLRIVGLGDNGGSITVGLYDYTNESFIDYPDVGGGEDAKAYLLGGYITAGDSQRKKQANYITCSFRRTEDGFVGSESTGWNAAHPSGALMQTQWEWTNNAGAGKWGNKQQVYRFPRLYVPEDPATDDFSDFGYTVINSRTKVRGMGKAMSILFETEEGKDFHLYGWGTVASIAQSP